MKEHYKTLGLEEGASQAEIQAAYNRLSKDLDPTKHNNEEFFVEEFKKVQEAYEALSNSSILGENALKVSPTTPTPKNSANSRNKAENKNKLKGDEKYGGNKNKKTGYLISIIVGVVIVLFCTVALFKMYSTEKQLIDQLKIKTNELDSKSGIEFQKQWDLNFNKDSLRTLVYEIDSIQKELERKIITFHDYSGELINYEFTKLHFDFINFSNIITEEKHFGYFKDFLRKKSKINDEVSDTLHFKNSDSLERYKRHLSSFYKKNNELISNRYLYEKAILNLTLAQILGKCDSIGILRNYDMPYDYPLVLSEIQNDEIFREEDRNYRIKDKNTFLENHPMAEKIQLDSTVSNLIEKFQESFEELKSFNNNEEAFRYFKKIELFTSYNKDLLLSYVFKSDLDLKYFTYLDEEKIDRISEVYTLFEDWVFDSVRDSGPPFNVLDSILKVEFDNQKILGKKVPKIFAIRYLTQKEPFTSEFTIHEDGGIFRNVTKIGANIKLSSAIRETLSYLKVSLDKNESILIANILATIGECDVSLKDYYHLMKVLQELDPYINANLSPKPHVFSSIAYVMLIASELKFELGQFQFDRQDWAGAISSYADALEYYPYNNSNYKANLYYNLYASKYNYGLNGNKLNSCDDLKQAAELNPEEYYSKYVKWCIN